MPAIAVGMSDPTTGSGGDYLDLKTDGSGNAYFYRAFIAMTKHINTRIGEIGLHVTYLKNNRTDYPLNGLGWGINFRPDFHKSLNLI